MAFKLGVGPGGVVQPFMGWVGNEGVDINWDLSPVSSPISVANSIKRKKESYDHCMWIFSNYSPVHTDAFSKVCVFIVILNASINSRSHYRFDAVRLSTLKGSKMRELHLVT